MKYNVHNKWYVVNKKFLMRRKKNRQHVTMDWNPSWRIGILLPKLFWPTLRKKCSSNREKPLKFVAEGLEFAKILRSLEQFIQTVKGQNNIW